MFEVTEDGGLAPAHHPFTQPVSLEDMVERPETAISRAYDLVLNGSELGSGSVRIHDPEIQQKVFEVLGISEAEAESRFGWFVKALGTERRRMRVSQLAWIACWRFCLSANQFVMSSHSPRPSVASIQ